MFPLFSPLEIDAEFERREYRLGGTVEVEVSLKARANVKVAQARVELVCRERFHEIHTVMVPASRPVVPSRFGGPQVPQFRIPKRVTEEFKNISIHSQEVFLSDFSFAKGASETFRVALHIEPDLPPYTDRGGTVRWRLAVSVEQDSGAVMFKEKRILVTW
jgi:hypothetical protein